MVDNQQQRRRRVKAGEIRQARIDVAAALRMAVRLGMHEGICNHFSVMLPGIDCFLLNPYGMHWSEVRASDLLVVDGEGRVLEGEGEAEATAFYIHSRIHRANPRATCVLHTHMPYATALTMIENGELEWAGQTALNFFDDVAYDRVYNGLVLDTREGDRLAAALGDKRVLFLANHGVIVIGRSVAEAFDDLYYLERACQAQVIAMSTGRKLLRVPDETARAFNANTTERARQGRLHFAALKRLLDRDEADYAQ
jgi:ribulose-5-phosphate 4-epimerase/fuculose-1-phosphate aldolase